MGSFYGYDPMDLARINLETRNTLGAKAASSGSNAISSVGKIITEARKTGKEKEVKLQAYQQYKAFAETPEAKAAGITSSNLPDPNSIDDAAGYIAKLVALTPQWNAMLEKSGLSPEQINSLVQSAPQHMDKTGLATTVMDNAYARQEFDKMATQYGPKQPETPGFPTVTQTPADFVGPPAPSTPQAPPQTDPMASSSFVGPMQPAPEASAIPQVSAIPQNTLQPPRQALKDAMMNGILEGIQRNQITKAEMVRLRQEEAKFDLLDKQEEFEQKKMEYAERKAAIKAEEARVKGLGDTGREKGFGAVLAGYADFVDPATKKVVTEVDAQKYLEGGLPLLVQPKDRVIKHESTKLGGSTTGIFRFGGVEYSDRDIQNIRTQFSNALIRLQKAEDLGLEPNPNDVSTVSRYAVLIENYEKARYGNLNAPPPGMTVVGGAAPVATPAAAPTKKIGF